MTVLRRNDVGVWFKLRNGDYPWVKYMTLTLVDYIHRTLYTAAINPRNQAALLSDSPHLYERTPIRQCESAVGSREGTMVACASGGKIPRMSAIYRSKSIITIAIAPHPH